MVFDVRGLPVTGAFVLGKFTAKASSGGYTGGGAYWPLALGIDCAPAAPVVYALVANDQGEIKAVPVSNFTWTIDSPA